MAHGKFENGKISKWIQQFNKNNIIQFFEDIVSNTSFESATKVIIQLRHKNTQQISFGKSQKSNTEHVHCSLPKVKNKTKQKKFVKNERLSKLDIKVNMTKLTAVQIMNLFDAGITKVNKENPFFLTVKSEEFHSTVWSHCIRNQSLTHKYRTARTRVYARVHACGQAMPH